MRSPLAVGLALLLCGMAPSSQEGPPDKHIREFSQDGWTVQTDVSGKGAVLCAWTLYDTMAIIGETCHRNRDAALREELRDGVGRIENFIMANSRTPVSRQGLDDARRQRRAELDRGLCRQRDAVEMYRALREQGPEAVRSNIDDLLSIPREPVMNPCL
ncbi:MAG: hypothetical protein P0Y50_06885 [Candidatus Brevundimonas colombiensis]|uniref:Uncharacterized protein n=1 Tax=Candidatus Brevundimonas colombiensis TaxID=3121376 RepID=A0AAJ6BLB0_9CAUL|nr:hypothetical protein [Brevundimonas sp.]WEK41328.1 MAG: hypothetical protein P0Y50_06885 [Brevundimonas sp.]